jgi:hypothetical protein
VKPWHLFTAAGVTGALGLAVGGWFLVGGSPRGYVSDHYTRAVRYDSGTARAFTAAGTPTAVAHTIADHWRPAGRVVDGSGVYLRYSDTMIAVTPRGHGSVIRVDGFRSGYRHYYHHVGGYWTIPGGSGEKFRGGGPGSGK